MDQDVKEDRKGRLGFAGISKQQVFIMKNGYNAFVGTVRCRKFPFIAARPTNSEESKYFGAGPASTRLADQEHAVVLCIELICTADVLWVVSELGRLRSRTNFYLMDTEGSQTWRRVS
jgi:hypothetical protein